MYQGTDLFVYPSLFEGFGIPVLEALHSGVPVVTSEGSCFAEAGGEVAIYANPLNVNDLSLKIQMTLGQKNNPSQVLEHLKQFSAKAIAGQLVGVYESV